MLLTETARAFFENRGLARRSTARSVPAFGPGQRRYSGSLCPQSASCLVQEADRITRRATIPSKRRRLRPHDARRRPLAAPNLTRGFFGVFRYSRHALELVWTTNRALSIALALLTLAAGMLPAGVAYVGALIVDAVVAAIRGTRPACARADLLTRARASWSRMEGLLIAACASRRSAGFRLPVAASRAARPARQRDDPREGADARARALRGLGVLRQADARAARGLEPAAVAGHAQLRPVRRTRIALVSYRHAARRTSRRGRWSCWCSAACPSFVAEAQFSGDAFRLFRWRSPGDAHADLPRDGARARGSRQGGQALRRRAAVPRALSRRSSERCTARTATSRSGATAGDSCSGSSATATLYGAYAWVALATIARAHHARRR